jgi:hypothetical protein
MNRALSRKVKLLLEQAHRSPADPVNAKLIENLPNPVRRYLKLAQVVGKKIPRTVHLRQTGSFKTGPDRKWTPMVGEQWFSLDPPGFIWQGTIRLSPLLWISATDSFVNGHGSLGVKGMSVIPIGKFSGPETDSGELARFLLELVWFPSSWLSKFIVWQPVDEQSAGVAIHVGNVHASAFVFFGEDGLPARTLTNRYRVVGGRFEMTTWLARCKDYQDIHGVLVPFEVSVAWVLPEGEFEYFRGTITELTYAW